jgi:hypothetical protein
VPLVCSGAIDESFAYKDNASTTWMIASNDHATDTTFLNIKGQLSRIGTTLAGKDFAIHANYTAAGLLDSLWATTNGSASFAGRRYLWNTTLGTLTDIRIDTPGRAAKNTDISWDNLLRPIKRVYAGGDQWDVKHVTTGARAGVDGNTGSLAELERRIEYINGKIRTHFKTETAEDEGHFYGYDGLGRLLRDTAATVESIDCTWDDDSGYECPDPTADEITRFVYDAVGHVDSGRVSVLNDTLVGAYSTGNRMDAFDGCN